MRWNDPATSQKEELLFAVNEMRNCIKEGIIPRNATLQCIINIAQVYDTDGKVNGELSDKQRQTAVRLILEACVSAKKSKLMKNYNFTAQVAHNLRSLKAGKECIQVVRSLISSDGICKHRKCLEEGTYAALETRDHESLQLFNDVYRKSGFDSRKLSL